MGLGQSDLGKYRLVTSKVHQMNGGGGGVGGIEVAQNGLPSTL